MSEHDVSLVALLFLVFSLAIVGSYLTASSIVEKAKSTGERAIRMLSGLTAFWLVSSAIEALKRLI